MVRILFGHNIHITINNTVIAENSGFIAGNMYTSISFGVEHVAVRLDRCYIHSGNLTQFAAPFSLATGLIGSITSVYEHTNGNRIPLQISNTKFISNYSGAVLFGIGGKSGCICNSSAYQILVDNCEFFNNSAQFRYTAISAGMMSNNLNPRVTVHETVLKVRLVIQNSTFHHNIELQTVSQQNVDFIQFYQLPEVEIINSTFYSMEPLRGCKFLF